MDTGSALTKVVDAFISLGAGGILCLPLLGALWLQWRRINELTDKVFDVAVAATKTASDSAASNNRLADMLSVRREDK